MLLFGLPKRLHSDLQSGLNADARLLAKATSCSSISGFMLTTLTLTPAWIVRSVGINHPCVDEFPPSPSGQCERSNLSRAPENSISDNRQTHLYNKKLLNQIPTLN